ncbi:GNAT family N-acetyltransferase [Streptacidiphilus sp. PB12-B1b]|uniref:GNAT family N-acetyltransferase n=1 Tax=Streptacidiphilus sp. PB12-B1b TaxID=2705012 RepID=UPI0015FB79CC|nr:GNAT family N-acetyltransferase [Streptacidiphilus sp. PB12-B1b]QMU77988.1 GNAT family N-acetyltransferase [Streptacidiphilus sp. PB12-B1b]
MPFALTTAQLDDVDGLLTLYRQVYGRSYALPLGTDPEVMAHEITSPLTTWLVARQPGSGRIVGSILGTLDPAEGLGKLQGLVVHPDARGSGLAHQAVRQLSDLMLSGDRPADSVYSTARTNSTAPQRICLRSGFHPLGMFPNLRKADRHETMVLVARYREGVLERRLPVPRVPAALGGLVRALKGALDGAPGGADLPLPEIVDQPLGEVRGRRGAAGLEVEVIDAPRFVLRRMAEAVPDPDRRFYPFHTPNVLLSSQDGAHEVYAQLNASDGYCTLIGASPGLTAVGDDLGPLIERLAEYGASYIETLLPMDRYDDLRLLLAHGFLPAAAYPAMRRHGDGFRDHVVMARTLQPLDFRGLAIDAAFQPFTEQYIELWKQQYLDTHGVFQ